MSETAQYEPGAPAGKDASEEYGDLVFALARASAAGDTGAARTAVVKMARWHRRQGENVYADELIRHFNSGLARFYLIKSVETV